MHTTPHRQRGLSFLAWLFILALTLFLALLGMKLVPTYMENYSIRSVLNSLEREPRFKENDPRRMRKLIQRRLKINSVYDMDPKNIKIKKTREKVTIRIVYSVRKPMVGNISVIMDFDDQVEF